MSLVKIEIGDWLKNASIVGLLKVLEHKKQSINEVNIQKNYIEFDTSMLEGFEEAYFQVLFKEHGKSISWFKLVSYMDELNFMAENETTEKSIDKLNKIIDKIKSMIKSASYQSAYEILSDEKDKKWILNKEKELVKIKYKKKYNPLEFKEQVSEQIVVINEIINWFKKPEVKKFIMAKNVMYEVIQPFWNNVSILLPTKNKLDMYELYKQDFIDNFINYSESDKSKNKYNCFTCNNKIKKLSKPEAFELTWLVKTGVDMSKKSSHFWNMNGDAYICPICNLVYSCLPLGFIVKNKKGIFINNNQNIKSLKQCNIVATNYEDKKYEEIENLSYYNVLNSMENVSIENIEKEFENIQVVKIDGNNDRRPYSFNILSPRLMKILYFHRKNLESLIKIRVKITEKYYLNLYDEVIRRIYDGKNLLDLIHKLLIMYLDDKKFKGINIIYKILKINSSLMGGKDMRQEDINNFRNYGIRLKEAYEKKNGKSKLSGISYRLLNAIKTKDTGKFMDTILNAHMYMRMELPKELGLALRDNDKLQNIGYAFVLGLQSETLKKENEGEN